MIIQKIKKTLKAYYDFLYISNEQHEKLEVLLRSQKNANYLESIDELLNFIDFSYTWSAKHKEGIVFDERLILICNLPMGGLDVLATVKAISEVRKNIIVVTRSNILPLIEQTGITVVAWDSVNIESNWEKIDKMFLDDGTLLVFPSINIGGLKWRGIRNSRWDIEMMQIFNRYKCSVQPLALYGNNSYLFYFFQHFITRFSSNFLKREIFVRKNDTVEIKISKPIQADAFNGLKKKALVRCIKKHILLLSRGKQEFFKTMTPVIHPVDCRLLRKEVFKSEMLGFTEDHKLIIITSFDQSPNTMKEIGRLRETTFRYMGEGTGNRKDIDEYDEYYKHIILWDDVDMEIVGSYRLGLGSEIINGKEKINQRMYTRSLFDYNDKINPYLANAIECGRSFVQKKYWNSRALDYLWHGIGAYLAKYPEIKYLFGPVSIPSNYSPEAKDLIIYYYKKWYSPKISFVKAKLPYFISGEKLKDLSDVFDANNVKDDFLILRKQLKFLGYTVPTLFKQYTDLCVEGGVYFHDFSVDPLFGHCVDGFIFLELSKVEEKKKSRYIKSKLQGDKQEPTIHSLFEGQSK